MSKAGSRLLGAAREMRAIARGEAMPVRMHVPAEFDVKAIRKAVKLTQEGFANEFGFTLAQVRDWEQGRTRPIQSDRVYLMLIASHPDEVRRMLAETRRTAEESVLVHACC
ncbi:MAG: helix-turn-helix protein [Microvirga sp.]|jgi:putative transcriptional regulator|nr:helix-turn-helix protein [Microvirga sp.]